LSIITRELLATGSCRSTPARAAAAAHRFANPGRNRPSAPDQPGRDTPKQSSSDRAGRPVAGRGRIGQLIGTTSISATPVDYKLRNRPRPGTEQRGPSGSPSCACASYRDGYARVYEKIGSARVPKVRSPGVPWSMKYISATLRDRAQAPLAAIANGCRLLTIGGSARRPRQPIPAQGTVRDRRLSALQALNPLLARPAPRGRRPRLMPSETSTHRLCERDLRRGSRHSRPNQPPVVVRRIPAEDLRPSFVASIFRRSAPVASATVLDTRPLPISLQDARHGSKVGVIGDRALLVNAAVRPGHDPGRHPIETPAAGGVGCGSRPGQSGAGRADRRRLGSTWACPQRRAASCRARPRQLPTAAARSISTSTRTQSSKFQSNCRSRHVSGSHLRGRTSPLSDGIWASRLMP